MPQEKHGKWTILKESNTFNRRRCYECQCDCGVKKSIPIHFLLNEIKNKKTICPNCDKKEGPE